MIHSCRGEEDWFIKQTNRNEYLIMLSYQKKYRVGVCIEIMPRTRIYSHHDHFQADYHNEDELFEDR
jgi:hypothetical protein